MAAGKWIGGFLGFITAGPLGALAGIALGALFDKGLKAVGEDTGEYAQGRGGSAFGGGNSAFGGTGGYGQQGYSQAYEGQRNSFMFSLLVLSSYIIRADGRVMHSEMELVRQFLRQNFGSAAQAQGEDIILKLFEQQKLMGMEQYRTVIQDSCRQIQRNMVYEQRLQLLGFLVMIAKADGEVVMAEIEALKEVAIHMGLSAGDVEQMLYMGGGYYQNGYQSGSQGGYRSSANAQNQQSQLAAAYKVLGISPTATDAEVKSAYRKMALKHHPDKVSALGEDVRKAAEKKFQEINDAKDRIYKARGMV